MIKFKDLKKKKKKKTEQKSIFLRPVSEQY
jgi:hypothetical protein